MKYIVANWKLHHTTDSTRAFLQESREYLHRADNVEVILCPPFPLLQTVSEERLYPKIKIGSQNISQFESGAYTGEVSAVQLNGLAEYTIVGHSERKKYFGETIDTIWQKVNLAREHGLKPILCFENVEELKIINDANDLLLAYEPTFAIGTGNPDTPENAVNIAQKARQLIKANVPVLYGGSVKADNVKTFVSNEEISGCLVGAASVEADSFIRLVQAVNH
jgi:triosephosphate isomerase (TIM)